MPLDQSLQTAQILAFRPRAVIPDNHFTVADKMAVMRWEAGGARDLRLTIFSRQHDDPPEVGEFAHIYPADGCWAAWGVARQGVNISVWRADDGRDIGHFQTMTDALHAVAGTARKRARR